MERNRHKVKQYKRYVMVFTLLMLLTACGDTEVLISIDKIPISSEEIMLFAEQFKTKVRGEYQQKIKVKLPENEFWNTLVDGKTPKEELLCLAAESAIEAKTLQIWAKEEGLIKDVSIEVFKEELEKENERRTETVKEGGVIYGPVTYEAKDYYEYYLNGLKQKLIDKEIKKNMDEKILLNYYEGHKESYKRGDNVLGTLEIWQDGMAISSAEIEVTAETMRTMTEGNEELVKQLLKLQEGESAAWSDAMAQQCKLTCTDRADGGYYDFYDVIQAVQAEYLETWFDTQLDQRVHDLDVQYYGDGQKKTFNSVLTIK